MNLVSEILHHQTEHVYQSMWNVNNLSVFGYEALIRFPSGFMNGDIEKVFRVAKKAGVLYELDTQSIVHAIERFPIHELKQGQLLFINLFPSSLIHRQFASFLNELLKNFPKIRGKIAIELNEASTEDAIWGLALMKERVKLLKDNGFYIALDDLSDRKGDIEKIVDYAPDFIKLDRYLATDLAHSKKKQQLISHYAQYASDKQGIILEGIEEEVDLEQAMRLEIPVVQGYLLGRPEPIAEGRLHLKIGELYA